MYCDKVILDGDCRFNECNFGNLFTDAMVFENALKFTGDSGWTDASIAIMQGGGIRASIAKGNITLYDLNMAYPFEHTKMAKVFLTGADLLAVLEHSIHRYILVYMRSANTHNVQYRITLYNKNILQIQQYIGTWRIFAIIWAACGI